MYLHIHNAKKVTFDGRDCFILSLNAGDSLLFIKAEGRYDPDATSEHNTLDEAMEAARRLGQRRGITEVSVTPDGGGFQKFNLQRQG